VLASLTNVNSRPGYRRRYNAPTACAEVPPHQSITKVNVATHNDRAAWQFPALLALTFGAMVVWPMLGIAASFSMFDKISEGVLFFGGFTALLLLPVYVILPLSETALGIAIIAVWLFIWIGCSLLLTSGSRTRSAQTTVLAALSGISLAQSALAFLMILGKSV
jgi:hypothetical protein